MINDLSGQYFIPNKKYVSFHKLRGKLSNHNNDKKVGFLSIENIKRINVIFSLAIKDITKEEDKMLWLSNKKRKEDEVNYRNKAIHRYFIGIDEMSVNIHREKLTDKDRKMLKAKGGYKYSVKFNPEYSFDQIIISIGKLINNLDLMISKLMKLDIMKEVIKPKESTD